MIEIEKVSKGFPEQKRNARFTALVRVSLSVAPGELFCLLGPSGCGECTLLGILAGFIAPDTGEVRIDGEPVTGPSPSRVMIFQHYGLLLWRTVAANAALGLEIRGVPRAEREAKAAHYLELVGLGGAKDKHPAQPSKGMQQRVAIARALAVEPEVLFMDGPFGALDAITRMRLHEDVKRLSQETGTTIVFVTHDIEEAVHLADRIAVMAANPRRIHEVLPVQMP